MTQLPKILLIDDEEEFCQQAVKAFEKRYEIISCTEKNRAIDWLIQKDFDLILLDLLLESKTQPDGFELISRIRDQNTRIPIIAVTKDESRETTHKAFAKYNMINIILKRNQFESWVPIIDKAIEKYIRKSVFISYSSQDKDFVHGLKKRLESDSSRIKCIIYEEEASIGQDIRHKMMNMIDKCDGLLLIVSKNSIIEGSHVDKEVDYAKDCNREVLPILLEKIDIKTETPRNWRFAHGLHNMESVNIYEVRELLYEKSNQLRNGISIFDMDHFHIEDAQILLERKINQLKEAIFKLKTDSRQ